VDHQLFVIRHGQTEWSLNGRHTGATDIPLTAAGVEQAKQAGKTLRALVGAAKPAAVFSSPRQRAVRTAELAGLHVDEATEELSEWDYGDYEGITTQEIHRTVPDWSIWKDGAPSGESVKQVQKRAEQLLEKLLKPLAERPVILVGHGHFSRVLIACWLGQSAAFGVHFGLDPAGITVLGHERDVRQITHLNVPAMEPAS
jgi:probable phosphoglycerate mutase